MALTSATTDAPATIKGLPQLQRPGLGGHGDPDSCCRARARRRVCPSSVGPNSPSQVPSQGRRCPRQLRPAVLTPSTRQQAAHARRQSGTARRALPGAPGTSPPRAPGRARSPHGCTLRTSAARPRSCTLRTSAARSWLRDSGPPEVLCASPRFLKGQSLKPQACAFGHLSKSWSTCENELRVRNGTPLCRCAFEVLNERELLQQLQDQLFESFISVCF